MARRKQHHGLQWLAGICFVSAVATVLYSMTTPVLVTGFVSEDALPKRSPKTADNNTGKSNTPASYLPALVSYAPAWQMHLRPVIAAPAPAPEPVRQVASTPPPPPSKPFTAKLTGTILEDNHSMALFTTQTGEIQFVSVGQMIEDARVVKIDSEKVILDNNGQTLTVELTESQDSSNYNTPSRTLRPNIYNRRRVQP